MQQTTLIRINAADNMAVALQPLQKGQIVGWEGGEITLLNDIPFGHKVALVDLAEGDNVIKYGYPIGHATAPVKRGEHVHSHNLKTNLSGELAYTYAPGEVSHEAPRTATFEGYLRPDGRAGIRNELWIIPTVGCVNTTATRLAKMAQEKYGHLVDGVHAFTHNMGCSQLGEDMATTQKILAGLCHHPNAGGVLILSLGCENNNLDVFMPVLGEVDPNQTKTLVTQTVEDEYEAGLELLGQLAEHAAAQKRQTLPADKLVVGFKCGGSDAFSGITANPLCGRINDIVTACGGSTILTEVPEMFGAETLLMARAVNENVFDKTVSLINNFKGYFIRHDQPIYENPSPGNKAGGITTLEEKSLGCTQKGGMAPVVDVLQLGQQATQNGLHLLTGPGNDQVSLTNLVASGAQMVLFTTGRGNPFGGAAPTVKVATNTPLATKKPHWIDYNAGQILDGKSMDEVADDFFGYLLEVASGKQTRNEEYDYREISIFRDGVIL